MSKGVVSVLLLLWVSVITGSGQPAKENKAETLARWHFVGTRQLSQGQDLKVLKEILALKESVELRNVAAQTFASQAAGRFTGVDTNANAAITAAIKPLLVDLIENESQFELVSTGGQDADWALNVQLPPERVSEWNKSLSQIAEQARMQITKGEKSEGWTATREKYRVSFNPSKDGLLLEGGMVEPGGKNKKLNLTKRGKQVLTADVNLPALGKIWSAPRLEHGPKLNLTVTPRKEGLRSEMLIEYPQSLNITPEPWKIPTELIRDPLIGFTAIQGVRDAISHLKGFQTLGVEKTPNQVFLWAQGNTPFTVFAAADVGNPGQVISNIVKGVLPDINTGARVVIATNRPAIVWRGFPAVVPFIEAANEGRSPFLVAGLFPLSTNGTQPAPPELFDQLKKKNLVYYDWELTSERLKQLRPIWQFAQIVQGKVFPTSASEQWLDAVFPRLGNTITEVTLENQNRLKLVRQSETGLSALEMLLLAHWVDPNDLNIARSSANQPPRQGRLRPAQPKRAAPQQVNPATPKP